MADVQPLARQLARAVARSLQSPYGGVSLDFQALAPDTDGIMQGVLTGTGGLTSTHASTHYAKDEATGYYNAFGANKAVWRGGRFIDEDNVSANDGGGAPYAEAPFYQFSQAATNLNPYARDFSNWSNASTPSATANTTGIDGTANAATEIGDNNAGQREGKYIDVPITANKNDVFGVWWVKKDTDQTRFPMVGIWLNTELAQFHVNTETGVCTGRTPNDASAECESSDDGNGFWKVIVNVTNNNRSMARLHAYGADATVAGTSSNAATGSAIFDCVMLFENTSIVKVRDLPPIFTNGSAASIDENPGSVDDANHSQTNYGYTFKWVPSYATAEVSGDLELLSLANGANLSYYDGTNGNAESTDGTNTAADAQTLVSGTTYRISLAIGQSGASNLAVAVDAGAWVEATYDGEFALGTLLQMFRNHGHPGRMRDLRGYAGSYATMKSKLDTVRGA